MNFKPLLFLFLFPVFAMGQYHITGRVTDILTKKPVENASVFLSNAMAGTRTNQDGVFDIDNVHLGHYDLVVSIVGYVTYHQEVDVNANVEELKLKIEAKNNTLKEVKIGPNLDWDRDYQYFKKQFLGTSENSMSVKILNPDVLSLHFDAEKREFTASSYDFLEIENKALGYKIKYLLANLQTNATPLNEVALYYEGSPFFQDLPGKPSQIKKWQKQRLDTYLGSEMHFLRSIIADRVAEEGFTVMRLIRKPNPDYPKKTSQKYNATLVNTPLGINDYAKRTDQPNQYALDFKDCLFINYKRTPTSAPISSIITFTEQYAYFDNNGIIINPRSAVSEGAWGNYRMGEMLPVDYEPIVK